MCCLLFPGDGRLAVNRLVVIKVPAELKVIAALYFNIHCVGGQVFARHSTANTEKSAHLDLNLGWEKFGSLTSATVSDFDDLRQGGARNPFYGDFGARDFYVERIDGVDSMITNSAMLKENPDSVRNMQEVSPRRNSHASQKGPPP